MKKFLWIIISLFPFLPLVAQQEIPGKEYGLISVNNTFYLGGMQLLDSYLSPLEYRGMSLRFENNRKRFFSTENTNLSMQSRINVTIGMARNPARSAMMNYLAFNYGWGMYYHIRPVANLQILAGGIADLDLGGKMVARNVNNPANADLAGNINASCIIQYSIPTRKRNLLLQAMIQVPLLGVMFVPEQGASYYEMFSLGALRNTAHFTFFHNKYGINQSYSIEIPFSKSTLRLGFSSQFIKYTANNLVFKKLDYAFMIGWKQEIISFAGRNKKAPAGFVSVSL